MPAETDEQKQEMLRKRGERLPMEEMRTRQHERLATKTTADKDTRLQQISALQHKLKGNQLRVPLRDQIAADEYQSV